MKWIKAGDGVPNEPDMKQWRFTETKEPCLWHQMKRIAASENRSDEVEWLDESPTAPLSDGQDFNWMGFIQWYSGMEEYKIKNAIYRYKKEIEQGRV